MSDRHFLNNLINTIDPIEMHIASEINNLRNKLNRLSSYVEKSGMRARLKKPSNWKPYDFFHYFCSLYLEKYRKEYRVSGNIIRSYQKIEEFISVNDISNEEYKVFIEKAFNNYFNENKHAVIGSICSGKLYNYLMVEKKKEVTREDWVDLDHQIKLENKKFMKYIQNDDSVNSQVDVALELDNERFLDE